MTCKHRFTKQMNSYRKNYPHGRKSNAVYTIRKIIRKCQNCGFKFPPKDLNTLNNFIKYEN